MEVLLGVELGFPSVAQFTTQMCETFVSVLSCKGVPQSLIVQGCETTWLPRALSGHWCKERESRNRVGKNSKVWNKRPSIKETRKRVKLGSGWASVPTEEEIKGRSFPTASSKLWPPPPLFDQMCALPLNSWQEGWLLNADTFSR